MVANIEDLEGVDNYAAMILRKDNPHFVDYVSEFNNTVVLNQAVKRNMKRFPDYYMFRLTEEEWNNWKSQFVTSNYMSEDEIQAIKMGVRRPVDIVTEHTADDFISRL